MKSALELQNEIAEQNAKAEAIIACCKEEKREATTEEQTELDSFYGTDGNDGQLAQLTATLKSRQNIERRQAEIASQKLGANIQKRQNAMNKQSLVPAKAKRHGNLVCFDNDDQGQRDAYISGKYLMAKIFRHEPSMRFLKENGLYAQQDETATQGLELIPTPLEAAIVKRLVMESTILSEVRTSTMVSQTHKVPDRLAGVTVYYPDENIAITPSHETFAQITINARKMATLTQISSEVNEDSLINLIDELAMDIAHQFAIKVEQDIVLGDGTATYGSVTGLGTNVQAASEVTGAGATSAALTLANYEACVALNPFFQGAVPKWYCSHSVWANSILPLVNAQGGSTGTELVNGFQKRFMGYDVVILQQMDDGSSASTHQVYFGAMNQSVFYGQRRGITIATSEHYGFNTDSIYIRGVLRNGATVDNHDDTNPGSLTTIVTTA